MVMVGIPIIVGNSGGSKSLHGSNRIIGGRDWAARVPDQAKAINDSGAWIYFGQEIHAADDGWKDNAYPAGGHKYLEAALKALNAEWTLGAGAEGNWCYYRSSKVTQTAKAQFHFSKFDRALTDSTFTVVDPSGAGFQFHGVNTHFTAHDDPGHDKARAIQARESATWMNKIGRGFFVGDINSSTTTKKTYPRRILEDKGGLFGLRKRGSVVNGGLSSFSKSAKKSYWLDDIFTRKSETVTGAELLLTNGVNGSKIITDHNWLKATIVFDAGALSGVTGPWIPRPSTRPLVDPPEPTGNPWVASVRLPDDRLADPVTYGTATVVENYNGPDMLMLTGRADDLTAQFYPGYGIVVDDDHGNQRFSGRVTSLEELGDGTANLAFTGDLIWTSWRGCYPNPAVQWSAQGTKPGLADVVTGSAEGRILSYINRNLGPAALDDDGEAGNLPRRHPRLRVPANLLRGPVGTTTAAPTDTLLTTVAVLAEAAGLRLRIVQTYDLDGTPWLDVRLDEAPDLSEWAQFGSAAGGAQFMLGAGWRYKVDAPTATTVLSIGSTALPDNAADGAVEPAFYSADTDDDAEDLWLARIEQVLDQKSTTDRTELAAGIDAALASGAGPSETVLPPISAPGLGTTIPVGSLVTAMVGDLPIVDRIRQLTTVIADNDGQQTVQTTGVIGDPNASTKTPTQRKLAALLQRVQRLERTRP